MAVLPSGLRDKAPFIRVDSSSALLYSECIFINSWTAHRLTKRGANK